MCTAASIWTFLLMSCVAINAGSVAGLSGYRSERQLRKFLFENYDKLVRPVMIPSNKINVSVGIAPLALRELDEKNQVIIIDAWMKMKWQDEYLKWDPSDYGNLSVLRLPSTEVWKPDVAVYSASSPQDLFPQPLTQVLIENNGDVLWVPPHTIKSRCPMFSRAPKNIIKCNIRVGSWTYSANEMDVNLYSSGVDLSYFMGNNVDWKLMAVISNREARYYPCCKEAYPLLHFNVTLKRRKPFDENELFASEDSGLQLLKSTEQQLKKDIE